jgi:origin recognition complex subunit 3
MQVMSSESLIPYASKTTDCMLLSRHIPKLPLIFLASSSSTSISNVLQSAYPRATLSLLRARHIHVPSPVNILEEVVAKVLFIAVF